jgi:hypothetical protein
MSTFDFTDEEFLKVINSLCKIDLDTDEYTPLNSINDELNLDELDSLSMTVFFIWIVHLFGVPENIMREFISKRDFTIKKIKEFVTNEATKTYSYADAAKEIQGSYFGGK